MPIIFKDGFYYLENLTTFTNHNLLKFSENLGVSGVYPDQNLVESFFDDSKRVVGIDYQKVNKDTFETLEFCILNSISVNFSYSNKNRQINPYKLINLNGIWYLVATEDGKIKNFTLSKIQNLSQAKGFKKDKDTEKFIEENSDQFVSKDVVKVRLKIKKEVGEFILRRKIFKRQIVLKQLQNGDLIVETRVAFLKDFMGVVRYWLPFVSILEPIWLRDELLKELEIYIKDERGLDVCW